MQSLCGNPTFSTPHSMQRVEDTRNSRRHDLIGPSRTRLVNRHNPYASAVPEKDTDGSTQKGQRRNRRGERLRPSAKRPSVIDADFAMAATSGSWEGASQDDPDPRLSESTPAPPLAPTPILPEAQSNYTQNCASTAALPSPPNTPHLVAQDLSLDEFGLPSFLEHEDDYGSNFFNSFDLGYSTSRPERVTTPTQEEEEEEALPIISHLPTSHPESVRRSAGKINLSSLHHRMMRSKGYIPDVSLDQLDGVVRKQILRQVDRLMFEYQAQSREQRKWRGYREREDSDLLRRPKKVRFNPCSTEGRRRKRSVNSSVDELAHRINRIQLSTSC